MFAPISDRVTGVVVEPSHEWSPGLHTLDLATGQPVWRQAAPACAQKPLCWQAFSAALSGVVFSGAIDGPSPTIANGMVFVSSGYDPFGQMPGNVLLAFGVGAR